MDGAPDVEELDVDVLDLSKTLLNDAYVYILDCDSETFVWMGRRSKPAHRKVFFLSLLSPSLPFFSHHFFSFLFFYLFHYFFDLTLKGKVGMVLARRLMDDMERPPWGDKNPHVKLSLSSFFSFWFVF